jgi:hypothetical protein
MEVESKTLTEFILEFDKHLSRRMRIIAVGGTALTLLGKKASTKDIDFCFVQDSDKKSFVKIARRLGYISESARLVCRDLTIDVYSNGYIFCVQLPSDYAANAVKIREMQKIDLFALSPLDLIITKASRFNDRDKEDILTIIDAYDVSLQELVSRWISTMENSLVRDAKEHLGVLLNIFEERGKKDQVALAMAKRWIDG